MLTNLTSSIFTNQAMWQFTFPIFQLIFFFTSETVKSLQFFTTVNHTCCTFQNKRRITICTNTFLVSYTTFFNFLAHRVFSDVVSAIARLTAKIIIILAIIDYTPAFRLFERSIALNTIVVFFAFTSKNFISEAIILGQTEIGITLLTNSEGIIDIGLTIFYTLFTAAIFQNKIFIICKKYLKHN